MNNNTTPETTQHESNKNNAPKVNILEQYAKSIQFIREINNVNTALKSTKPEISLNLDLNVKGMDDSKYDVSVLIKITSNIQQQDKESIPLFSLDMEYIISIQAFNFTNEQLEQLLLIHCPTIAFPFIRKIVSDLTIEGGFPPLSLDIIDFAKMYHSKGQETKNSNQIYN